ncbi:C40 family peptidase [Robertmurraya beringensis]|uniref:C40 family peptidase n=1 Tax=Robertmurraya beringensis TaxID=641660 RepID=A0ABV6KX43_9BACI
MMKIAKFVSAILISIPLIFSPIKDIQAAEKDSLVDYAQQFIGVPYKYGGTTPSGFDCSGFLSYVFSEYGIELPRRSVDQFNSGKQVKASELTAGDLVFFNTSGSGVSHVGIYLDNNKFIHADSSNGIMINSLGESYYKSRYVGAKRYLEPQMSIASVSVKSGQIGTVYIKKRINLWERDANNNLVMVRVLQPGDHYRVYGYDEQFGGQYNLGSQLFVTKMEDYIEYQEVGK